jgi:hypothetical protein
MIVLARRKFKSLSRYTLFLQSRCGYACGDRETSLFGRHQRLAGTTELLDSGRTWDLSVNEAKGSPVTRLRLRSSRWTSCHLNLLNGLRIQNDSSNRRVGTHIFQPLGRAPAPTDRTSTRRTLARFFGGYMGPFTPVEGED